MSSLDVTEERNSKLGKKLTETFQTKMQRGKKKEEKRKNRNCQELWDSFKGYKIHITKIPEERRRQKKYLELHGQ